MELFEIQQHMNNKTLPSFLIFIGPEYKIKQLYVDHISKIYNLSIVNIDECANIIALGKVSSLLSNNCLYVCKYDKSLISKPKYWNNIDTKLGDNKLILILEDLDKKSKFYTTFKDRMVEFCYQPHDTVKLMLSDYKLNNEILEDIIVKYDGNYSLMCTELDKLVQYCRYSKENINEAYKHVHKDILCYSNDVHKELMSLQNKLLIRDTSAIQSLEVLLKEQEPVLKIIGYIYTAFRQQLIVDSCYATPQSTGLSSFIIANCLKRKGVYSIDKLIYNIRLIKDVEQGIKNGKYEDVFGVRYLVCGLL